MAITHLIESRGQKIGNDNVMTLACLAWTCGMTVGGFIAEQVAASIPAQQLAMAVLAGANVLYVIANGFFANQKTCSSEV